MGQGLRREPGDEATEDVGDVNNAASKFVLYVKSRKKVLVLISHDSCVLELKRCPQEY